MIVLITELTMFLGLVSFVLSSGQSSLLVTSGLNRLMTTHLLLMNTMIKENQPASVDFCYTVSTCLRVEPFLSLNGTTFLVFCLFCSYEKSFVHFIIYMLEHTSRGSPLNHAKLRSWQYL